MIRTVTVPKGGFESSAKRKLEEKNYRAAEYWSRFKRVTPGQLQNLTELGLINSVRLEIGKGSKYRTYYYYLERQVDKAVKKMYPKSKK